MLFASAGAICGWFTTVAAEAALFWRALSRPLLPIVQPKSIDRAMIRTPNVRLRCWRKNVGFAVLNH